MAADEQIEGDEEVVREGLAGDEPDTREQAELEAMADVSESDLYAALCYVPIVVIGVWFLRAEDAALDFHIKQGLVVTVALVLAALAAAWLPIVGSIAAVAILIGNIVALVQALQGRAWRIPGLGWLADRFTF